MKSAKKRVIESGIRVADTKIQKENRIWSRYSHDKIDIGEELAGVIRILAKRLPLSLPMRALSIGSSAEPQFRILETFFRGGLYLLDVDADALGIVRERIRRQYTDHVTTIRGDYKRIFLSPENTEAFLKNKLDKKKVNLVTLHHSLYYSEQRDWIAMFENVYRRILGPKAAMHAVLMSAESRDPHTTTWLYNHFAGKSCGCSKRQNLYKLKKELEKRPAFKTARVSLATHRIRFRVNDFKKFMAVIWMVLLYPDVHKYTRPQKEEIAEFVYRKFWLGKKPLIQEQDHLVIYKRKGG